MEPQVGLSTENILTILGGVGVIFGGFYGLLSRKFSGIDKKFDKQDAYMREMKKDTDAKFDKIDQKFDKIDQKFDKIQISIKEVVDKLASFEKTTEHRLTVLEMEAKNTNQRLSTIEGYLVPKKVYEFRETRREEEEPKEN